MGEAIALTMSLNTCPCNVPTIFLLDSRIVLLQVFLYFFPTSQTIRNTLRRHIHTTSIHHFSELSHALQHHWPDANIRPDTMQCDPQVPPSVRHTFLHIIDAITTDIAPKVICHLDSPHEQDNSRTVTTACNNTTVGLRIGHHLFLHVSSHQLTNTGKQRTTTTDDGRVITIPPKPNLTLALANTWADRAASRLLQSIQDNIPRMLLRDIPQPPLTTLQYEFHHHNRTVNTDITQYIQNQFVNHNFKLAIQDPSQWFLHFGIYFSDPLERFHDTPPLCSIAQDRAPSHSRYVKINKNYRLIMQKQCHPSNTFPHKHYTSTMLQCPFCPHSTIPATITHHHLACTHKVIAQKRHALTQPINDVLLQLDTLTQSIISFIFPFQHEHRYIPRFSKFLRAAIQHATFITTLTDEEHQEYVATTIYPPFRHISYPNKPHWRPIVIGTQSYPPTTAHYSHLMGPSTDPPMHPMEHSTVTALLGLLPTNTHIALEAYLQMLSTKFHSSYNANLPTDQRPDVDPPSLQDIMKLLDTNPPTADTTPFRTILRTAQIQHPNANTIADLLHTLLKNLLQALQTKAKRLQLKISSFLHTHITRQIKKHKPTPISVPSTPSLSPKPSRPPRRKKPRHPCSGTWCVIRKAAGIPWSTTTNSAACTQCRLMMEAINLSTRLLAQLLVRSNAITLLLQYTPAAPHRMTLENIANNTAIVPTQLDNIRHIICTTIPFTVINAISPHLNFLHPKDAQYEKPREDLQQLVLQLIAYSSLILPNPALTREFPPLSPYSIHAILTKATTFCQCPATRSNPLKFCRTQICNDCSHLIQNKAHVPSTDHLDLHTCITCDTTIPCPTFPSMPCDTCCLITILVQNNPSFTWTRLIKPIAPSVKTYIHNTPIRFLPKTIRIPPIHSPLQSADIFLPSTILPTPATYPFTNDPDFSFQEFPEEESFLTHRIFPPRPPPMPFPKTYSNPATKAHNIITNVYRFSHPAMFSHPGNVYLTYTRPSFPFIDGILTPAYGHYPEAYIDTNLPNLSAALPHADIISVPLEQYHPMEEYIATINGHLTITWSFKSHDHLDNNQLLHRTPETFILTIYPPVSSHPPFQLRLLFFQGNHLDEIPEPTLKHTDVILFLANEKNETPTIYVLAIIYLLVTLPPEFVRTETLCQYRLLHPPVLRHLSKEMVYLHAILQNDNYASLLSTITSPWELTYHQPQPPYTKTILYRENPTRKKHYKRHREIINNSPHNSE